MISNLRFEISDRLGETPRQAGMLFSAHTGSMALGVLVGIIQARWMEPAELGRFAFCLSILVIAGLFFEMGVFPAGARVLALAENEESERQILGALVLMATVLGVCLSLFVVAAAFPIDAFFKKDVRWLLIATSALAFFQPFHSFVEQCCQGLNQIRRLSIFQLTMTGVYLLGLIFLVITDELTAVTALAANLMGIGVAAVWTIARLRPSFSHTRANVKLTLKEVRRFGLNMYLARVTGAALSRLDNLVIAYFLVDLSPLGLYAIAQKLSAPILAISRAVAITRFRAFAKLERVPARLVRWNACVLIVAALLLSIVGPFALGLAFPKYAGAAPLIVPFAALNLFAGLFQPYNMFMASHGRGSEIRNIAIIVTASSLTGLLLAVPRYGIMGAAWVGAATMALDYLLYLYYYQKFRRTIEHKG